MTNRKPLNKALFVWLAVFGGTFGAQRFYVPAHTVLAQAWRWTLVVLGVLGWWGFYRHSSLGQDDRLSWLLLPLLGLVIALSALDALIHGLMSASAWNGKFNLGHSADHPAGASNWPSTLGLLAAMLIGATALMSAIVLTAQRYFELQVG